MATPALALSDEQLRAMEDRLAATSPGPWCHRLLGFIETTHEPVQTIGVTCQRHEPHEARLPASENADFIAHAREDIPLLIAEVRRLRDQVRQLEDAVALTKGRSAADVSPPGIV